MRIDRCLNLVISVTRTDGSQLSVHASPLSSEVFDKFWEPIDLTVTAIFLDGHGIVGGPRIAHKMLRKMAQRLGLWEKPDGSPVPDGVKAALLPEIRRLTHVILPGQNGYELQPFDVAKRNGTLDAQEVDEIEGRLCFFMCCWAVVLSEDQGRLLSEAAGLWKAQLISLNCTEYLNSLQISTPAASSGVRLAVV